MRIRTVKLEGRLTSLAPHTFEYPFGSIEAITSGRWEIAISSVTAIFSKNLPWNTIFEVSTNYVEHIVINQTVRVREQMPLAFVRFKGQPRDQVLLGFKWRDFFEVTTPSKMLTLTLKPQKDPEIPDDPTPVGRERSAYVSILLIFRRVE